jgi:hypothetical protein
MFFPFGFDNEIVLPDDLPGFWVFVPRTIPECCGLIFEVIFQNIAIGCPIGSSASLHPSCPGFS